jgi:hypothetical protein
MSNRQRDRKEQEKIARIAADALARLPVVKAPDAIWNSIEASLSAKTLESPRSSPWTLRVLLPAAALLLLFITWSWYRLHRPQWEVVRTREGQTSPTETVSAGEWLQTDASSSARLQVGTIGTVEIEPGTRLRIVTTKPNENRLSLEHGEIAATILAPPKLFFVETKSATAVDLGCQYRMNVDEAGNGLLRVTRGWVSFEWHGRESLVPAGALCRTRAGAGPGTPFFDGAPPNFTTALDAFDFSGGSETSLRTILSEARSRDTLTLWHLLSRVDERLRPLVYDRMISFAPPPPGVIREKALALDAQTLKMWKDELTWTW